MQDSIHYWASAGKTLTGFTIGIAQQEGWLHVDDTASNYLGNGWTSAPLAKERLITLRNLLTMTSGLNDTTGSNDCDSPSCLKYLVDAGTRWAYHSGAYTVLHHVIDSATHIHFPQYCQNRVGAHIGMAGFWYTMPTNEEVYFSTARDAARFGLLLMNRGIWNTDTVLRDTAYFQQMTNTSQPFNPSYGYLTWLNGKSSYMEPQLQYSFPGYLMPHAPADLFAALGKNDQLIHVAPAEGMVMIRMGDAADTQALALTNFDDSVWVYLNSMTCNLGIASTLKTTFSIYPNPATSELHVIGAAPQAIITITALDGRAILSTQNTTVTIASLSPGLYLLRCGVQSRLFRKE